MTTQELIKQTKESLNRYKGMKGDIDRARFISEMGSRLNHLESLLLAERNPDVLKEMMTSFRDELLVPFKELFVEGKKLFPETIKVGNEITVANQIKELKISNLGDIKLADEIKVSNLKDFPKEIVAKNPSFSQMVKELGLIKATLNKIATATGKAVVTGELTIKNSKPADAIPVRLVTENGKSFYNAIQQAVFGGSSGGEFKLKNAGNTIINPATEETLQDVLTALGGSSEVSASDGTAEVVTAGTRVQLSNIACRKVIIQAHESNTGTIAVGGSAVVAALSGRRGVTLFPTQSQVFEVTNLNKLYIDSTASGDKINFYYETT